MTRWRVDGAPVDAAIEIERFASFDHPTRRFIAYAIGHVPELAAFVGEQATHAGNAPAPFVVKDAERVERDLAYSAVPLLRSCRDKGAEGQNQRRLQFGALLGMAKVDVRWKRLKDVPEFIFCYERLVGHQWRQLLIPCWIEAAHQRRKKGAVQLPLDRRLRDDAAVPKSLRRPPADVLSVDGGRGCVWQSSAGRTVKGKADPGSARNDAGTVSVTELNSVTRASLVADPSDGSSHSSTLDPDCQAQSLACARRLETLDILNQNG